MSEAQPASVAVQERRRAISPYLQLIDAGADRGEERPPNRIPIQNRIIELSNWEWSILSRGLQQCRDEANDQQPIDGWPRRLAESVAFQARYLTHMSRIQEGPRPEPSELPAFRSELLTDAALGLALQEELQRDVDNLVTVGNLDDAKKLTAFRHKIGQSIGRLKEVVGEEGFRSAEVRAAEMAAPAPKQPTVRPALDLAEEEDERPAQFKRDVSHGAAHGIEIRPRSLVKPLSLTLVAATILMAIVWGATRRVPGPPILPEKMFLEIAGVRAVTVRPPSLFVTVEEQAWQALDPAGQLALVDRVAEIAAKNRYSGVQFRTPAGTSVARWLRKSGSRLEPPPAPHS